MPPSTTPAPAKEKEKPKKPRRESLVTTQVSIGNFDSTVTAKHLADYLEVTVGMVDRCRLKTSWTPPDSYPDFLTPPGPSLPRRPDFDRVPPHAFVHFSTPAAAARALHSAADLSLRLHARLLRLHSLAADTSGRIHRRRTTDPFRFPALPLSLGTLTSPHRFLSAWHRPHTDLLIDPFDNSLKLLFTRDTAFSFKNAADVAVINCDFKLDLPVRDISRFTVFRDTAPFVLLIHNVSTPLLSYRTADDDVYQSVPVTLLDDEDPWTRTTDFTDGGAVGRCHWYRVEMPVHYGPRLEKALRYLRERRVAEEVPVPGRGIAVSDEPDFGKPMSDFFYCVQNVDGISFPTLFLVNALVHKGVVSQHALTDEFFDLLRGKSEVVNDRALRHMWAYKNPVFDARRRLELVQNWLVKNPKLLKGVPDVPDYAQVRRLVITPTKAHCLPPEVELSNRVLRKYRDLSDRFLRVTFMDEGMQQLNSNVLNHYVAQIVRDITEGSNFQQKTTVFRRVKDMLNNGFYLCGRKYSFLAFSSNQLRDKSAWFFADTKTTTVTTIKKWMGRFTNRNVAKCAARMGQCFSSTYATVNVPENERVKIEDIELNNYVFSDGIGMITPDLALEVAAKLQLSEDPPSAYQIRYAGCKGVVAVWPRKNDGKMDGIRLTLRESMEKFKSTHTMLEVVSWTRFQPGFLNRQIIILLTTLGVPDDVFDKMQDLMVWRLNQMFVDNDVAFEVLTTSCMQQGDTAAMMLSAGFKPQTEPHLNGMLSCIRAAQLGDLLEKTRIFVEKGRWLIGCLDETGVLEQGQCFVQVSTPSLENCFSKHGSTFSFTKSNRQIVTGYVIMAKNPCLHPGDIRILQAVDVPCLHHLVDCLVFPQKGDRPHSNEASGSDLDGDNYFVTWDENLIPPNKRNWNPMDYSAAEAKECPRQVETQDIIAFYLKSIGNDSLGIICNAHVVHADRSEYGAADEKCIHLAELAATAVDTAKTGKIVTMPHDLKPRVYPDFMGKDDSQSYKSEKILGRLYRKIKSFTDADVATELSCAYVDLPYDIELELPGASDYIANAWDCKCSYDGQLNALLAQYKVRSEGEVATGHIWSLPKYNSRKQGELKERLKSAYSALQKEFRRAFETLELTSVELTDDEKSALYEKKASAWYQVTYHPRWVQKSGELQEPEGESVPARLSFAWIAADYLVRIKVKSRETKLESKKPVDSLANYLCKRL